MSQPHHEIQFESYIVDQLLRQGWLEGTSSDYDTERALYPEDVLAWVQTSQGEKWKKLKANNGQRADVVLLDRLASALQAEGTVKVLRRGFSVAGGGHLEMSEAAPEDKRNQAVIERYRANRLRVVRQLKYNPAHAWAIDLVFFINGIPVATVELKTDFTQSVDDAMAQYRKDRLPVHPKTKRKEPLLTFKRGAVVHFAMSDSDIRMATKLDGDKTYFLPFNMGNEGRAGNPTRKDGEYPVAYFWERVLQPDAWLRIFHSFVYTEKKKKQNAQGVWFTAETLIFPRFHQWDAVNKMITDAKGNGAGQQYLCEHSAGSGKTSTIAWTAHDLIRLRNDQGDAIFDAVIIVTDRNVLDSQLQEAVKDIDHQFGVIAAIDRQKSSKSKSKQLTEALLNGTPIIVVTIQTFPFAMEAILTEKSMADKKFAVIIDEAHNSQTGTTASKLQATLSLKDKGEMGAMTIEELLEHIQNSRKRPKNVSHFAFTATPKHSTMMLFGRPTDPSQPLSDDNPPESFHRYPMRQAIEEGFILDVLQNFTPYKVAFNLSEQIKDDKRVDKKQANRALAKWMTLHPTNVTQKVEFIIEHFAQNVGHLLRGEAKAMVVTSSRAAVVRYKVAFDKYIEDHPEYRDIKALVAFSGKLKGREVNHPGDDRLKDDVLRVQEDDEFTEISMNPGIHGSDLRKVFERPEYRVMLVANKFQTGFDQPKLVSMYVDKKIANEVEIVQTFSRLNRTHAGKDITYIIDFINSPEVVQAAFRRYDAGAQIDAVQDPNVVYVIKNHLDDLSIYDESDLEAFKQARFKLIRSNIAENTIHKALYAATQRPTDVFNKKLDSLNSAIATWEGVYEKARIQGDANGMEHAEHERSEHAAQRETLMLFKANLGRFCRTYAYVTQLIQFGDPDLENFAAFAKLLAKRLDGISIENVDLKGLALTGFDMKLKEKPGEPPEDEDLDLKPVGPGSSQGRDREKEMLSEIISHLNQIFGDATPIQDQVDFFNQTQRIVSENDVVMAQVEHNTRSQAMQGDLPEAVQRAIVRAMTSHKDLATHLLKADKQAMGAYINMVYDAVKSGKPLSLGD